MAAGVGWAPVSGIVLLLL